MYVEPIPKPAKRQKTRKTGLKPGKPLKTSAGRPIPRAATARTRARDSIDGYLVCQFPCCNQRAQDGAHHIDPRARYGARRRVERDDDGNRVHLCDAHHERAQLNEGGEGDFWRAAKAQGILGEANRRARDALALQMGLVTPSQLDRFYGEG